MSIRNLSVLAGAGLPIVIPPDVNKALEAVEIVSAIGERGSFRLFFRLDRDMRLPGRFLTDSGDLLRVVLLVGRGKAASVAMDGVIVDHRVSGAGRNQKPMLVLGGE